MHKIFTKIALIAVLFSGSSMLISTKISAEAFANNFTKGVNIRSRYSTDYYSDAFHQSVDKMKNLGANSVTLTVQYNMDNLYSNTMYPGGNAPTDDALVSGIKYVQSKGMKPAISMFVETNAGDWRAYIDPSDRNVWFANYTNVIKKYATIAQNNNVAYLSLGTEFASLTSPRTNAVNTQKWRDLIRSARSVYSGQLTYGGNWGDPFAEMEYIEFWDALDFIGVSAYFDLSKDETPSVQTLTNAWTRIDRNILQPLANRTGKSIVFTEMGYRSVNQAANAPGDWSRQAYFMEDGQVNAYEALFSFFNNKSYLTGIGLWDVSSDPNYGGQGNTDYTFINKKAEATIKKWYNEGATSTPPPTPTPVPTPVPTPTPAFTPIGSLGNLGKFSSEIFTDVNNLNPNQSATIKVNIQNRSSSINNSNVYLVIYDKDGNEVANSVTKGQNLNAGGVKTYEINLNPKNAGTYSLRGGVFSADWGTTFEWFGNIGNLNVKAPATPPPTNNINTNLNVWWPAPYTNMSGVAPFKAVVDGKNLNEYKMFWQVDGDKSIEMYDSNDGGYDHKENYINFANWTWKGGNTYKITFTAKDNNGQVLGTKSVDIYANK